MSNNIISLKNNYIQNTLYIQFGNISKYLEYNEYYPFYKMYAPKDIEIFNRKCKYCHKIPICPVSIQHPTNKKLKCNKSLINTTCYICTLENWICNFNKLKYRDKYDIGFKCPFECCQIKCKLNKYGDNMIDFNNYWKYLPKVNYYKCKLCNKVLLNKTHYEIYKHHKLSYCSIILKKFKNGNHSTCESSDESSDSDSEYEL